MSEITPENVTVPKSVLPSWGILKMRVTPLPTPVAQAAQGYFAAEDDIVRGVQVDIQVVSASGARGVAQEGDVVGEDAGGYEAGCPSANGVRVEEAAVEGDRPGAEGIIIVACTLEPLTVVPPV